VPIPLETGCTSLQCTRYILSFSNECLPSEALCIGGSLRGSLRQTQGKLQRRKAISKLNNWTLTDLVLFGTMKEREVIGCVRKLHHCQAYFRTKTMTESEGKLEVRWRFQRLPLFLPISHFKIEQLNACPQSQSTTEDWLWFYHLAQYVLKGIKSKIFFPNPS